MPATPYLINSKNPSGILRRAQSLIRQPSFIAILVSLGVHGLLWKILPLLPAPSMRPTADQSVSVIELGPSAQGRLPSFAQPELEDGINPSDLSQLPTLDPQSLEALPDTQPPLEPLSPPQDFPSFDLGPLPPLPLPPEPPPLTLPPPASEPITPDEAQPTPPAEGNSQADSSGPGQEESPYLPGVLEADPNLPEISAAPPTVDPGPPQEVSPPEASTPAPTPALPEKLSDEAIAYHLARIRKGREKYAFDATNTTAEEAAGNIARWTQRIQSEIVTDLSQLAEMTTEPAVTSLYPKDACFGQLRGKAVVGVLVNPDGTLAEAPVLLQSSGYQLLNQAAIDHAADLSFETGEKYRPMLVPFKFQYRPANCGVG